MGFKENLQTDTVGELSLREAVTVSEGTVVRGAVAQMRHKGLGCAVIVDYSDKPVGIFTERSVIDVLVHDASLDTRSVDEFVDRDFLLVKRGEPILSVWDAIQQRGLRFVCVTDEDGKVIGITGQRGLAEYVAESFPQHVMVQRLGSKASMQTREGA